MFLNKETKGKINSEGGRISYRRKRRIFGLTFVQFLILTLVLCVIAFAGGMAFRFYAAMNATTADITEQIADTLGVDSPEYKALKEQGHFNMLVLGSDDVEGSKRSDTILFVTVELDDKCVKVLSLPRDTYVAIPGHGNHKLNSSFAFGGVELLKTTIENYLGEPILYYVVVDYSSFPKLVDAFGGVEINVKKKMHYVDRAGHLNIDFDPGLQHMDGTAALHYVRFRKDALGDIGRVHRQQQFIKALLKKAYSPAVIARLPNIAAKATDVFETNMPVTLAAALAGFAKNELKREDIYMSTLFGNADMIDALSYWIGDPASGKEFINATREDLVTGNSKLGESGVSSGYVKGYSSADEEGKSSGDRKAGEKTVSRVKSKQELTSAIKAITQPVAVLNGSGEKGLSDKVAQGLQLIGIDVVYKGNAKHYDYMYTNVIYPPKSSSEVINSAANLANLLGVPKNLLRPNQQASYVSVVVGHDYKDVISLLEQIKHFCSNGTAY